MNFEILEHTADIGFRAWGASWEELLNHASLALVSIAIELDDIEPRTAYPIAAQGEDPESLLVNWLNEVLYYVDGENVALSRFEIQRADNHTACGVGFGEPRATKHRAKLIVKGVTYHQLQVEQNAEGWSCQVFLDI
jgi:SHS2 domain-containing protein